MSRKHVYLACFGLHFFFIVALSGLQLITLVRGGATVLPPFTGSWWQRIETIASVALGERLADSSVVRKCLAAYEHGAGIESSYGFFAPNVPNSYKLVFELQYRDGRVDYWLPEVGEAATGLRLTGLLDDIARTRYNALREVMIKMLAYSAWREHPEATSIRAVFGEVIVPSALEFRQGKKDSYEFLYAYDFQFRSPGD